VSALTADTDRRADIVGATVLVIDDNATDRSVLETHLTHLGCRVVTAGDGISGLHAALRSPPDLILLDVMLPDVDGFVVCRRLKGEPTLEAVPIVMVTALDAVDDRVRGLDAGADDFLSKPFAHAELKARVRSLLRLKSYRDHMLAQRSALTEWSNLLEERVAEKILEVERLSHLKRFFSPRLAQRLVAEGRDDLLASHRRDVTVLFADLRNFTAFAERAEADQVMAVLRDFHTAMGELIHRFEGTLERFTGDGLMVFFNDPDPLEDHGAHAVALACAMQARAGELALRWKPVNGPTGIGIGLSQGPATVGAIGFEGRQDYAAIGSVTNRAARLCGESLTGEVLVCQQVWASLRGRAEGSLAGDYRLKGFSQPVPGYRIEKPAV
jgi:adenylate cyclase